MREQQVTICNELGLHARAAARLVETASGFESAVEVRNGERKANAKSIMGVLMLAAAQGVELRVRTEGPDEEEALEAVCALVKNGFGEL